MSCRPTPQRSKAVIYRWSAESHSEPQVTIGDGLYFVVRFSVLTAPVFTSRSVRVSVTVNPGAPWLGEQAEQLADRRGRRRGGECRTGDLPAQDVRNEHVGLVSPPLVMVEG